jgi:hypothetical protein
MVLCLGLSVSLSFSLLLSPGSGRPCSLNYSNDVCQPSA